MAQKEQADLLLKIGDVQIVRGGGSGRRVAEGVIAASGQTRSERRKAQPRSEVLHPDRPVAELTTHIRAGRLGSFRRNVHVAYVRQAVAEHIFGREIGGMRGGAAK